MTTLSPYLESRVKRLKQFAHLVRKDELDSLAMEDWTELAEFLDATAREIESLDAKIQHLQDEKK